MRACVRAQIRVGKGARRAKLFISLEPRRTSKCFRRFEQGSTKQTENMYVSPVLSELAPTSAGSSRQIKPLWMSMNVFFSIQAQSYKHLVPKYSIFTVRWRKVLQTASNESRLEEDSSE